MICVELPPRHNVNQNASIQTTKAFRKPCWPHPVILARPPTRDHLISEDLCSELLEVTRVTTVTGSVWMEHHIIFGCQVGNPLGEPPTGRRDSPLLPAHVSQALITSFESFLLSTDEGEFVGIYPHCFSPLTSSILLAGDKSWAAAFTLAEDQISGQSKRRLIREDNQNPLQTPL